MFLINLIPLHVLALMLTGRFSHRIYVAYCTVYCLGTILSMQISFVGFQPVQSSEHMAVSSWIYFHWSWTFFYLLEVQHWRSNSAYSCIVKHRLLFSGSWSIRIVSNPCLHRLSSFSSEQRTVRCLVPKFSDLIRSCLLGSSWSRYGSW